MSNKTEISKESLETIKTLLPNLTASDVWGLVNHIREACSVLIPVWFTIPLVQEVCDVHLTEEQAQDLIENINDDDMTYTFGRELVESAMDAYLPKLNIDTTCKKSEDSSNEENEQ